MVNQNVKLDGRPPLLVGEIWSVNSHDRSRSLCVLSLGARSSRLAGVFTDETEQKRSHSHRGTAPPYRDASFESRMAHQQKTISYTFYMPSTAVPHAGLNAEARLCDIRNFPAINHPCNISDPSPSESSYIGLGLDLQGGAQKDVILLF